jgi:ABC-2 type transport system ATP-binding protein
VTPTFPTSPLLRAWNVTASYGDGTTALSGLHVEVPRGSVGLVGANGAGKTTLFRLMLGLMAPVQGQVEVVGRQVAVDPLGVRSRLGYMPEHDCLPSDQSASDFVASFGEIAGLTPRAARQRASDVLDLVGLDEARFRPIGGFSTGMRQRTKLAQALVAGPEAVLLDEPTAGLDPIGRDEMLALVDRLGGLGISLVFATHLLDDVQQVCEHVVMLDAGRLALVGRVDELVQRTGVVRVEVGPGALQPTGDPATALVSALAGRGTVARQVDEGTVDIDTTTGGEAVLDLVRDTVADLSLRLYSLSSRHRSLDDVVQSEVAR